ncbi:hypothetical protein P4493_22840 [Bacillus thuringiensis]|uniref:Uncharacterized protein n=3 Tax=Bacillus thuringiensis TaxID=1428 RepID=A0AB35PA27_BACTU|nr:MULTISPECIES: hypothetical protein [Bacillus]MED1157339.1 hypothetical protein [Bacillus paranthracis]AFQ25801.1 hypothetical protein BTF1_07950 [Bacillus thuringiensis HD-789]AJH05451.1 hypothetical protein AS86_1897 [Bacillus thuringiensis HD1002]AND23971.1 hypothetical protein ATN07_10475 [Bacillus thuringiensis serovar israelensis]EXL37811.1 hypothetical protein BG78_16445 [Bacillus thuringiensis serovar israelensis]
MQEKQLRYFTRVMNAYSLESIEEAQRFYKLFSALKLLPQSKRKELVDIAFERINEGKSIVDK